MDGLVLGQGDVAGILSGHKTQHAMLMHELVPAIGQTLFVRESVARIEIEHSDALMVIYRASHDRASIEEAVGDRAVVWVHPVDMPEEFARIYLEVTGVTIARLFDATEADARREYISWENWMPDAAIEDWEMQYVTAWDRRNEVFGTKSIHNPWVRRIRFEMI
jgi:hypothetical protein